MTRMRDLLIDVQDAIEQNILSFHEIARVYNVPLQFVKDAYDLLRDSNSV